MRTAVKNLRAMLMCLHDDIEMELPRKHSNRGKNCSAFPTPDFVLILSLSFETAIRPSRLSRQKNLSLSIGKDQNMTFKATWSCREVVEVTVITPAEGL